MTVSTGVRLGHYETLSPLGKGEIDRYIFDGEQT
jgi:hypothetical protein